MYMRAGLMVASLLIGGMAPVGAAGSADLTVVVEGGNIAVVRGATRKALTYQKRDSEAVLSPDRAWIIYTRSAKARTAGGDEHDEAGDCASLSAPDELRRIRIDGAGDELLVRGRAGAEPSQALCGFSGKQFSSDGATLYFLSPAWTTSSALHAFSLAQRTARYVMPSNDFAILNWCTSADLKDAIVSQQHRYLRFGGSYDWYWLFDPGGQKELGPVGELASIDAVRAELDASGQCTD